MASGNSLCVFQAMDGIPPTTAYATQDILAGGATPVEAAPVLDFDAATDEYIDFYGVLPQHYAGGGLTLTLVWSASSATSGDVIWGAAFRRINDDAEDIDTTAHSYDFNASAAATAPSAQGEVSYDNITFTDGADMDSLAAGEMFFLRIRRDADNGSDTMAGDAELHYVHVKET